MKKYPHALIVSLLATFAVVAGSVLAQAGDATVRLATDARWGEHLIGADGHSLYLYVLDEDGEIACVDACTNNWPPLTLEPGSEPTVGEGLDSALLGTVERADGTLQVTYGGHPLYAFRRDTEPGHTRGQRLGEQFFLVSAAGEAVTEEIEEDAVTLPEEEMAALVQAGQLVFNTHCAVCHGNEGQGGVGPRFAGNGQLADKNYVVGMVLNGFIDHGMPPFRGVLDDQQISGVTTFIRNSWGNEFGPVLEEEVAGQR